MWEYENESSMTHLEVLQNSELESFDYKGFDDEASNKYQVYHANYKHRILLYSLSSRLFSSIFSNESSLTTSEYLLCREFTQVW